MELSRFLFAWLLFDLDSYCWSWNTPENSFTFFTALKARLSAKVKWKFLSRPEGRLC